MDRHVRLLSERERKIIELLAEGHSDDSISRKLKVPEARVKHYVRNMLHKQGFVSPYQLINWAYREAIIS
ncbi:MAG TPA: helix-turn-helix transcriptional regulator [Pontibacter sp.]